MDTIIVLDSGKIVQAGTPNEVYPTAASLTEAEEPLLESKRSATVSETDQRRTSANEMATIDSTTVLTLPNSEVEPDEEPDFERQRGSWSVYTYYGRNAGALSALCYILSSAVAAAFGNISGKSLVANQSLRYSLVLMYPDLTRYMAAKMDGC